MFKKMLLLASGLLVISVSTYACPAEFADANAIQIAKVIMNTWFSDVEKGNAQGVAALFAPNAVILHSIGAPVTKSQEVHMTKGFHLGGYKFSDFCGRRTGDTIIATFASKTFNQDISKSGLNFLSKKKAYRMVVLQKSNGKWLIIGYANTNPLKVDMKKNAIGR